jgi:hypothetical protein
MGFLLQAGGLDEAGLFRIGGNKESIDRLRAHWDRCFQADDLAALQTALPSPTVGSPEVHDVSGLLKLFYRSLPEPLVPFKLYADFIKIGQQVLAASTPPERVAADLRALVQKISPLESQHALAHLCAFLSRVAANASVNKMVAANLSVCWTPNLLRPQKETPQSMMSDMQPGLAVITKLIELQHTVFAP